MIKNIVMMDLPIDDIAADGAVVLPRHTRRRSSRRYGPWLQRHESYVALDAPAGRAPVRLLQLARHGDVLARDAGGRGRRAPTASPRRPSGTPSPPAACPAQPDRGLLRLGRVRHRTAPASAGTCCSATPSGCASRTARTGIVNVHAPGGVQAAGAALASSASSAEQAARFRCRACGTRTPRRPQDMTLVQWDRVVELWYAELQPPGARRSSRSRRRTRRPSGPPIAFYPGRPRPQFPFFKPGVDFVSTFLLERPADEFLRDTRYYLP